MTNEEKARKIEEALRAIWPFIMEDIEEAGGKQYLTPRFLYAVGLVEEALGVEK